MPLISLGVPVYNGERYLEGCLDSLLGQTFGDIEVLVSDNASSDRTEEICRGRAASDPRLTYIRQPRNIGAPNNFAFTFARARGRFFKWCAHDDELTPTYLERCLEVFERGPEWVGAHSLVTFIGPEGDALPFDPQRAAYLDETGRTWIDSAAEVAFDHDDPVARFRSILLGKVWHPVWGLFRRQEMARTGLLRPFWGNDKAFLAEIALAGKIGILREPLFRLRCHAASAGQLPFTEINSWLKGKDKRLRPLGPQLATLRAYCGVIGGAPISLGQKLSCAAVLLKAAGAKWDKDSFVGLGSILASLAPRPKQRP